MNTEPWSGLPRVADPPVALSFHMWKTAHAHHPHLVCGQDGAGPSSHLRTVLCLLAADILAVSAGGTSSGHSGIGWPQATCGHR